MSNNDMSKSEIQRLVDIGLASQEKLKKSPELLIRGDKDIFMELRKVYLVESLGKNPSKHCYFCLYDQIQNYANMGYVPVLNENKEMIKVGTEPLVMMWRPIEIHKVQEVASQKRATQEMKQFQKSFQADRTRMRPNDVPTPDMGGVKVEKMEIQTGDVSNGIEV